MSSTQRDPIAVTYVPAPTRRPFRQRLGWAFRAWARSTFSRESLVSSFKSLLWVAPLTCLIWIYAEQRQVVPMTGVPLNVEVRNNEPGRVVRMVSPSGGSIHVDMMGPQADVEQVRRWLQSNNIPIDVDRNLSPGEHPIFLLSELNRLPRVVSLGITISNCVPPEATVYVDPITTIENVEVKARPEDTRTLGSPPIFNPPRIRISGPASVLEAANNQAKAQGSALVAYANFSPFKQNLTEPGKHALSALAVSTSVPIDDLQHVRLLPPAVSADIEVEIDKAEVKLTLPYLRVLAAYRPEAGGKADQYKAVYDPTLTNVTVSGPEQQIALLQDPNNPPTPAPAAIFEVNYNEIDNPNPAPAPVIFQLPPGVHVMEQDAQRKITYSFKPRTTEPQ